MNGAKGEYVVVSWEEEGHKLKLLSDTNIILLFSSMYGKHFRPWKRFGHSFDAF